MYHIIKDISLVHMDGDESLKLGSLHFRQVAGSLINESVEELKEGIVGLLHHLAVIAGILQGICGITGPDELDTKQSNLEKGKDMCESVLL